MTTLGIDPGFARCGYAFVTLENAKYKIIDASLIETKSDMPYQLRLKTIYDRLDELIKKYNPSNASIETLFFSKNTKTALQVSEARGVIILCLTQNNIDFTQYRPKEAKQLVTGTASATKEAMMKMIALYTGDKIIQDDTADAIAMAIALLSENKVIKALSK